MMGALVVPLGNGYSIAEAAVPDLSPDQPTAGSIINQPKPDVSNATAYTEQTYSLKLNTNKYTTKTMQVNGAAVAFRAYENRVYTAQPVDAEYEKMNIYIPEAYFAGKTINGYTAKTAPIFLPNEVGGYMPGEAGSPSEESRHGGANAALAALARGYVVAEPALRGRTLQSNDGAYTGKAPACIVDYKAAVRYLRYNKDRLPAGDTEKIVSNGTSAGGALSALLGATGNSKDYEPYLRKIGAADARDDIFASMDYCPITNLDHADMAYEWVFNGVNEYHQHKRMGGMMKPATDANGAMMPGTLQVGGKTLPLGPGPVILPDKNAAGAETGAQKPDRPANAPEESAETAVMTEQQMAASDKLKALFPDYVNSLGLRDAEGKPLTLDRDGNGSFKDYLESFYIASAQGALDRGEDLSKLDWLTIEDGRVTGMNLAKYAVYATRMKTAPAFDALDLSAGENNLFGTATTDNEHFTEFSAANGTSAAMADASIIRLMNPMNYIGQSSVTVARHWRIRHGAIDRDTSLAIPAILATKLMNSGYAVDFASPWNRGHDGDYDLSELFDWIDSICR